MGLVFAIVVELATLFATFLVLLGPSIEAPQPSGWRQPLTVFSIGTACAALIAYTHWHPLHW
jgi:hypothetical protein